MNNHANERERKREKNILTSDEQENSTASLNESSFLMSSAARRVCDWSEQRGCVEGARGPAAQSNPIQSELVLFARIAGEFT